MIKVSAMKLAKSLKLGYRHLIFIILSAFYYIICILSASGILFLLYYQQKYVCHDCFRISGDNINE